MFSHKLARFAAVMATLVASVIAGGQDALAVNEPGIGSSSRSTPLPVPVQPVAATNPNWALILMAVAVVIALAVLARSAVRTRVVRHA